MRTNRLDYYHRVLDAYLRPDRSQLSFWHETPQVNDEMTPGRLGPYYMPFTAKARFAGPFDEDGIPLLDYRGRLGLQYNPIAIAQYGLGNYNLFRTAGSDECRSRFIAVSDWLVGHLEMNPKGQWVWNHHFDWEYRTPLKAPWYSGLAQGQGISVLVRAYEETGKAEYLECAGKAFGCFLKCVTEGGVCYRDPEGRLWVEEYIVSPPTHILNGFIWASWGLYDYFLASSNQTAGRLFDAAVDTLATTLQTYDLGFWSLYEHSGTRLKMIASPFYHRLHIVQLRVLYRLTGSDVFERYAALWEGYARSAVNRWAALACKTAFKLAYY